MTIGWKPSARRARRSCSQCSWPFVSMSIVIATSPMLIEPPTRVWSSPVTLASFSAMMREIVAREPGRSSSIMRTVK